MKNFISILLVLFAITFTTAQQGEFLTTDVYGNIYQKNKRYSESEIKATIKIKFENFIFARTTLVNKYKEYDENPYLDQDYILMIKRLEKTEVITRNDYLFWFKIALRSGHKWAYDLPIRILSAWQIYRSSNGGKDLFDLYSYNKLERAEILSSEQKIFIENFRGEF